MPVLLTSFKRYHEQEQPPRGFSVAVYQPAKYPALPKLSIFDIRRHTGRWLMPRDFATTKGADLDAVRRYHDAMLVQFEERWALDERARSPLITLTELRAEEISLCCWCPYERAAQRQLEDYGSFICHTVVIETFLRNINVPVARDQDRKEGMVCL